MNICSRRNKQTTFSERKILTGYQLNNEACFSHDVGHMSHIVKSLDLSVAILSSAGDLCTHRTDRTESKQFDTLIVFLKNFFEKVNFEKCQQTTTKV